MRMKLMKLNSAEAATARLTLAVLESKLLDLVRHERFIEALPALSEPRTAAGTIVQLLHAADKLCRQELGMPPKEDHTGKPGVQ
jgi:hypothetical protein